MSWAWSAKKLGGGGLLLLRGLNFDAAERHAEELEELARLVIGFGGGDDRDVEAHRLLHVLEGDLGEDGEVGDTECVVALAVELRRDAAEIADGRKRHGEEAVKELPHRGTAEGHAATGRLVGLQLE